MLARQTVINRLVTLLSGATDAGTEVYATRFQAETEPYSIRVLVSEESPEDDLATEADIELKMDAQIEIRGKAISGVEAASNAIAAQVVALLLADKSLGIGASEISYSGASIEMSDEHEQEALVTSLGFDIWVRVDRTDHETIRSYD